MKTITRKLWMVIAMLSVTVYALAYDFEADGFYFNITNQTNKEVEVTYKATSYNSYSGVINIPSTVEYNGTTYTVTSIGSSAFSDCKGILSVNIPNSVTSIGASAFFNCTNIISLTIGSGVTSIGSSAFSTIQSSEYVYTIPKVIWLGNTPPSGVSNVKAALNYVSNSEFSLLGQKVYPFLSSRFEVDGVVYVPVSPSDRTCDVIDCNYDLNNTEIKIDSLVVNKNVELKVLNINTYAFYQNPKITKLEISNNGDIGIQAFYHCDALISVVANNNGNIESNAFYLCKALYSVVANNNGDIGVAAFQLCRALNSVIASNNGDIYWAAFNGCDNLTTLKAFNHGYIGAEAFINCVKLKTADLNISGSIQGSAFSGCTLLETANINIVGSIGNYCFQDCKSLTSVNLGNNITSIGSYAFSGNSSLETIVIPNNITSLGTSTFSGCTSLKNVSIGEGVTSLPQYVFNNCTSLPSIFIPNNINIIDDYAFYGCTNLGDITFEELITDVQPQYFPSWTSTNHTESISYYDYYIDVEDGDVLTFEVWSDCKANYDELWLFFDSVFYTSISGRNQTQNITRIFNKAYTAQLTVMYVKNSSKSEGADEAGIRNIVLNADRSIIVNLGSNGSSPLFSSCKLDEVYIGRKLSYKTSSNYGYSPFYRNTSLRKVTITDEETQIYDNEFYGCSNLQEFSCGDGVTSIGKWAFSGCSSLESYLSGTSVESIGQEAFSDCTAMTSFTTNAEIPPTCGTQALDDINKWECTLYVPQESLEDYKAAPQWKEFFFIEDSGVDDVTVDSTDVSSYPIEIYNLSGLKVGNSLNNLAPGIYIKRQGTKTEKIMVN